MPKNHRIPDPVHGTISIPNWLVEIENIPSVRRMMFIRQLGLKAYIDFPGAIHTRYSHALGAMHLAGLLVDKLSKKEHDKGHKNISENLQNNKNNLMAAGFLHDIAHGPFSHAIDFVMKTSMGTTHEILATDIIKNDLTALEPHGITSDAVIKIINKKHEHPFISGIINGPLDVDKLDYLLRDAHHVGLKYGFDLEYFVDSYTVLGDDGELRKCMLGLEDTPVAQVTSEIFILIWKSMYDLVYHVQDSRMAEKMLEKAVLLSIKDNPEIKRNFIDRKEFVKLQDDDLLHLISESKEKYPKILVNRIRERKLFDLKLELKLYDNAEVDHNFITTVGAADSLGTDTISDSLSKKLSTEMGCQEYGIICDILKTRVPANIHMNSLDKATGEPIELVNRSDIIKAMKERSLLRIYVDPEISKKVSEDLLKPKILKLMSVESGA